MTQRLPGTQFAAHARSHKVSHETWLSDSVPSWFHVEHRDTGFARSWFHVKHGTMPLCA